MKSRLSQRGIEESVIKDMRILAETPAEAFEQLISSIDQRAEPGELPDEDDLLPISKQSGVTLSKLYDCFKIALFLYRQEEEGDSLQDILEDMTASNTLSEEEARDIRTKIEVARPVLSGKIRKFAVLQRNVSLTFPTLEHIHTRCSTIVRFKEEFSKRDDQLSYSPAISDITPVVVVQMDLDRYNDTDRVSFALTDSKINDLIKQLQLAQVQLKKLSIYLAREGD